jgi:ArsR family transcriptional regulator
MKVLKYAGIVKDQRNGKWINYTLADRKALEALGLVEKQ